MKYQSSSRNHGNTQNHHSSVISAPYKRIHTMVLFQ